MLSLIKVLYIGKQGCLYLNIIDAVYNEWKAIQELFYINK